MSQPTAVQQELANQTVRAMYGSFPDESIGELIEISLQYERACPQAEIVAMTAALRAELERRQAERGR